MQTMKMNDQADYGNWVPAAMMKMMTATTAALCLLTIVLFAVVKIPIPGILAGLVSLASLSMTLYMGKCRQLFDFKGGNVMGNIHQFLVDNFLWKEAVGEEGSGRILDIGCGAGALTNRVALTFPKAEMLGIDYWSAEWSYAKDQCDRNADLEGLSGRTSFQKGDAASLDFEDGSFDGAVSNFVFHEVKSVKDKRNVVREGLRVIRPGGAFAFQDLFGQKALYGDMNQFLEDLKKEGAVKEIHYIPNIEKEDFVPAFVTAPWMIKDAGLIYGIR